MNESDEADRLRLLRMQPAFSVDVSEDAERVKERMKAALSQVDFREHVAMAGSCVDFKVDPMERRFWSPHLSVQIHPEPGGAHIHARFSPRPEIWTMFMAVYAVMGIVAFGAAIYAYVQWFLGSPPWALVVIPVCLFMIVMLHIASLIGQNLSADQMLTLRDRFDRVIAASTS